MLKYTAWSSGSYGLRFNICVAFVVEDSGWIGNQCFAIAPQSKLMLSCWMRHIATLHWAPTSRGGAKLMLWRSSNRLQPHACGQLIGHWTQTNFTGLVRFTHKLLLQKVGYIGLLSIKRGPRLPGVTSARWSFTKSQTKWALGQEQSKTV